MSRVAPTRAVPSTPDIRDASATDTYDKMMQREFSALWTFMMLLHGVCAVFLICCAKLYWVMENEYIDYFTNLLAPAHDRHFRVVGTASCVLGVVHALQCVSHLVASIRMWKLTVRILSPRSDIIAMSTSFINKFTCLRRRTIRSWKKQEHLKQNSSHEQKASGDEAYGRKFALRKIVEIATQVPGAYLYSTLIARPWINHAKVGLLVVNCWSAFIIHRLIIKPNSLKTKGAGSRTTRQFPRFSAIVVDALLSAAMGMLLPSAIFMPYLVNFDIETLDFPDALLYGDTEFTDLVLENRAFFAISWVDALIKGVPHLSVFVCLIDISLKLESASKAVSTSTSTRTRKILVNQSIVAVKSRRTIGVSKAIATSARFFHYVHHLVAPILFLVIGAAVIIIHLTAQSQTSRGDLADPCIQRIHPWFAPNISCAVVKYNCYAQGVSSPPPESLGWLERKALRNIVFMHCSEFVMPPIIREFPSLMGIELWNTTLVRWDEKSALSAELHPMMLFVNLAYVNMTQVPTGILQSPLPTRLTDLEFTHTNLTLLPDNIAESWSNVEVLYCEHSHLNPFPSIVMELPVLSELSLIGNKFETMPDDVLVTAATKYFYDLALSRNPLRKLPDARSEAFDVSCLSLEFTLVAKLPLWVHTSVWESVSLGGSPICESADNASFTTIEICGQDDHSWDPLGEERFPTLLVAQWRKL